VGRLLRQLQLAVFLSFLSVAGVEHLAADPVEPAKASDDVQRLNSGRAEERIEAAQRLAVNTDAALPALLSAVASFDGSGMQDLKPDRIQFFVAITDVLRIILVTNFDAVVEARTEVKRGDRGRILGPLIVATGNAERSVRINATVILASVVDNGTVCLVLDRLRTDSRNMPEKINLLQVVAAMAGYAYRENVAAATTTIERVKSQSSSYSPEEWRRIPGLLDQVSERLEQSKNKDVGIPGTEDQFCKDYSYRP
jgi:hypothetical protein